MEFHDLKDPEKTPARLMAAFQDFGFYIPKFHFERTTMNLNYGKLIATKKLK